MATSLSVQQATPGVCLTRGVPFSPAASSAGRQVEVEAQIREARQQQKEAKRAYGRKLDEDARQARKARRIEIEACYRERRDEG